MQLKQLLTEESAVSPVIGVILMVSVTVILAAITGAFVLGVGEEQQRTPAAAFDFDHDAVAGSVTVTHGGGDTFESSNTAGLVVQYVTGGADASTPFTLPVVSSDSITVSADAGTDVRVAWSSPRSAKAQILGSYEVPT